MFTRTFSRGVQRESPINWYSYGSSPTWGYLEINCYVFLLFIFWEDESGIGYRWSEHLISVWPLNLFLGILSPKFIHGQLPIRYVKILKSTSAFAYRASPVCWQVGRLPGSQLFLVYLQVSGPGLPVGNEDLRAQPASLGGIIPSGSTRLLFSTFPPSLDSVSVAKQDPSLWLRASLSENRWPFRVLSHRKYNLLHFSKKSSGCWVEDGM